MDVDADVVLGADLVHLRVEGSIVVLLRLAEWSQASRLNYEVLVRFFHFWKGLSNFFLRLGDRLLLLLIYRFYVNCYQFLCKCWEKGFGRWPKVLSILVLRRTGIAILGTSNFDIYVMLHVFWTEHIVIR